MTLAITPKNTLNNLLILVTASLSQSSVSPDITCALFQDATANALATYGFRGLQLNLGGMSFTHSMAAGTVAETTFRFRAGCNGAGTITFNGRSGVRFFNGTMASTMTILEFRP